MSAKGEQSFVKGSWLRRTVGPSHTTDCILSKYTYSSSGRGLIYSTLRVWPPLNPIRLIN